MQPFVRTESLPKGCVIVGWQTRYAGERDWRYTSEHPGCLPYGYAGRTVRPVYARVTDQVVQTFKTPQGS